ncbi:protein ripply2 isoform X1 [Rhinolophus sinicus]|uniref:protein ripply2 isoform X1 n=1 Tax=Rhinolophus sinicus TaxID=89399 RepID=UPI003D7A9521
METAERCESGARECARCSRLLPSVLDRPTWHGGSESGSGGFWRPWVDARGEREEEAPHHAAEAVSELRVAGSASEGRRRSTKAGDTRSEKDTCPACPSLKIAPAGGPTGGPVRADAASVSSRATGTHGSDRERGCSEPGSRSLRARGTLGSARFQFPEEDYFGQNQSVMITYIKKQKLF